MAGERLHVMGNSGSGKSTLGARLAEVLDAPFVELDAINWLPDWYGLNEHEPEELERRIREATAGERWVVAGSYTRFCQRAFWDRLETVVWLDRPMPLLLYRVLRRSWRRWRTRELLWGTNREKFWPHLAVWRGEESLVWWIVTQHRRKRRKMFALQQDPRWSHIQVVRLASQREIERFVTDLRRQVEAGR